MSPSNSEKINHVQNDDDESCCTNKKTHFYEFKEHDKVKKILSNLPLNITDMRNRERSYEQFLFICDTYQEQPHLIDPFLTEIIDTIINTVKREIQLKEPSKLIIDESFKYMHCLAKMRGYKRIVQYLPHEITDFDPVLKLLESQDPRDSNSWQTRFILLLWLSIICIVPFDLDRFDTTQNQVDSIANRFLKSTIPYLFTSDKCQDACAFLLAKFMSRRDLQTKVLPSFFDELITYMKDA
ncbi:unnamed protein product, partial [Brachionus calyciflorus]